MKKLIVTIALLSSAYCSSYAQGWVFFNNGTTTKVSTNSVVNGAATGTTFANAGTTATTYYYALFYSLTSNSVAGSTSAVVGTNGTYAFNATGWSFASTAFGSDYATNTTSTGRFNTEVADPANSQGTGIPSGAAQYFTVIGWSANIGNTWGNVQSYLANPGFNGWVGQSIVSGLITPGTGGLSSPPSIFGTATGLITGFTLGEVLGVSAVPEPGTLALAALGGASLLLFRRRK